MKPLLPLSLSLSIQCTSGSDGGRNDARLDDQSNNIVTYCRAQSVLELFRSHSGWTYIFLLTHTWVSRHRPLRFFAKTVSEVVSHLTPIIWIYDHNIIPCWNPTCTTSCWSRWRFWYRTWYGCDSGSHWNTDRSRRTCRPPRKVFGAKLCFRAP